MSGVREHKRKMVTGLNEMYLENYKKTGAEFMLGTGRFIAPRTVEATLPNGTIRQLRGENVIVSTGTRAALEAIPGLVEAQPLRHIEALELDRVRDHLLVMGGGYIGVELSQAMRRFGSKVTASLGPLHLVLADAPSPRGSDATLAGMGTLSEGFERFVAAPLQPRRRHDMARTV